MGKHDYSDNPQIGHNYKAAVIKLMRFMQDYLREPSNMSLFKLHLPYAIRSAELKTVRYQNDSKVNMRKEELLRDIVFLGAGLIEVSKGGTPYYQALTAAAFETTMLGARTAFDTNFVRKVSNAKAAFYHGQEFSATAFYLLFKSHFRTIELDTDIVP